MIEWLDKLDKELLLYLNSIHSPFWDEWMLKFTDRFFWIPFYLLVAAYIIFKFKKRSLAILITIALLVLSSDLITSSLMKPYFMRLRPCHNEELKQSLRLIKDCGGTFGFASSHAANTTALAVFLILLFKHQSRWIYVMILWAGIISYSRIYLAVHYPGDIITGALIGLILSLLYFDFYNRVSKKYFKTI